MSSIPDYILKAMASRGLRARVDREGYVHFEAKSKELGKYISLGRMVNPDGSSRSATDQDLVKLDRTSKPEFRKYPKKVALEEEKAIKKENGRWSETWAKEMGSAVRFAKKDGVHGFERLPLSERGGRKVVMAFDHYGNRLV